jgi:hypothetical protein
MKQVAVRLVAHGGLGIGEDMGLELFGFAGVQLDGDDNGESGHLILLGGVGLASM